MYKIEPKKVTRYFAEVEIDTNLGSETKVVEGKRIIKKSCGTKLTARRWIVKMIVLNEDGFFLMDEYAQKQYKEEHDTEEFFGKVNRIAEKMFGCKIYSGYRDRSCDDNEQYIDLSSGWGMGRGPLESFEL